MVLLLLFGLTAPAFEKPKDTGLEPRLKEGRKFRIGYCETEPFSNYAGILYGLMQGMAEYGWIKNVGSLPYIEGQSDTWSMWEFLALSDVGEYVEFPRDAHYTLSKMTTVDGKKPEDQIIERLNTRKDLDLLIVMGTRAGTLMANDKHAVPVFVFSASNAYRSGIVKAADYSGNSHVWAHMDLNRFKRQLQVFHDVFSFKKLGVVYEDSDLGRTYSALGDIEATAKERGFSIERELVREPAGPEDVERYRADLKAAYEKVAQRVDAFYITIASIDSAWLPELLEPFYQRKIPVFSQLGRDEVQHGAMMSITIYEFANMGRFGAHTLIKAMCGAPIEKLELTYENTPQIILNLEAAKRTGFKPTFDILLVADKIYQKIEK